MLRSLYNKVRHRAGNFSIYLIVTLAQRAVSFFLLPVYALYLQPAELGIVSIATAISAFLPPFIALNSYEFVYFIALKKDPGWENQVASFFSFQMILIGVLGPIFSLLFLVVPGDFQLFGVPFFPYIHYTLLFTLFSILFNSFSLLLQATNDVKAFSIMNVSFFLLSTGIVLTLLIGFEFKAMSIIYANLVAYVVFGIGIIVIIRRRFGWRLNKQEIKSGLSYSTPLIPHILSHWGKGWIDRIFLASYISTSSAGLFHFANTIGSVVTIALDSFVRVNNPEFFQKFGEPAQRASLVRTLHIAAAIFSFGALSVSLFAKEIFLLFDAAYFEAYKIIPFIVTGNLTYLIYLGMVNVLFIKRQTFTVSKITTGVVIVSSVISFFLIKHIGIVGAALSYLTSNVILGITVFLVVRRQEEVNWKFTRLLAILLLPMVGTLTGNFVPGGIGFRVLLLLICTLFLYVVGIAKIGFLNKFRT